MPECPSQHDLKDYALGKLDHDQLDVLEQHIDTCDLCQTTLETLNLDNDELIRAMRQARNEETVLEDDAWREAEQLVKAIGRDWSQGGISPSESVPPPLKQLRDYDLLEELGRGGMGTVYKAVHTKLKKVVALKVLPADRMENEESVRRFEREMQAVGQLHHPHIVQATDAGEVDDTHFLVMEYVEGLNLSELVDKCGPLPVAEACELIRQAALGIQHAHEHGMVHRDIKPSNLMLTESGQVKILDLGLALLSEGPAGGELTTTNQIMGTLDYMAPEQAADTHAVDIRADLYSLGATLYKLLAGKAPFHAEGSGSPARKLNALLNKTPESLREQRLDVPERIADLVNRLLAKDPDQRPATPAALIDEISLFAEGADVSQLLTRSQDGTLLTKRIPLATASSVNVSSHLIDTEIVGSPESGDGTEGPQAAISPAQPPAPPRRKIGLGMWGLFAAVLVAGIIVFTTKKGTVTVEIADKLADDVEVKIYTEDGEKVVEVLDANDGWSAKLAGGKYKLELSGGDAQFTLKENTLTVNRFGENIVRVEFKPTVVTDEIDYSHEREVAEWVISVGGQITVQLDDQSIDIKDSRSIPLGQFKLTGINLFNVKSDEPFNLQRLNGLGNLQELNLELSSVTDRDVNKLKDLPALSALYLSQTRTTNGALVQLDRFPSLTKLHFGNTLVDDNGLMLLAELTQLTDIRFRRTKTTAEGVKYLSQLTNLRHLDIGNYRLVNGFDDSVITQLIPSRDLISFGLDRSDLTDDGLRQLVETQPQLESLWLCRSKITDNGIPELLKLKGITGSLNLHGNQLTDKSIEYLKQINASGYGLLDTDVTAEGVAELHRARPDAQINWDGGVIKPGSPIIPTDYTLEREVAELVLDLGGSIGIEPLTPPQIKSREQLPKGTFSLHSLNIPRRGSTAEMFANLPKLPHLEQLSLYIEKESHLLDLSRLQFLKRLRVFAGPQVSDGQLKLLGEMTGLENLIVDGKHLDGSFLQAVTKLPNLKLIGVQYTSATDENLKYLREMPHLINVGLGGPEITDEIFSHLSSLDRLEELAFYSAPRITGEGVENLAGLPIWELKFSHCSLSDENLQHVLQFPHLQKLFLINVPVGDAAFEDLQENNSLDMLDLSDTSVTDATLSQLAKFKRLRNLNLSGTQATDEGIAKFQEAMPQVNITRDRSLDENDPATSTNYALSFDGVDDYVELPTFDYDPNAPLTVEAWVTPRSIEHKHEIMLLPSGLGLVLYSHSAGSGMFNQEKSWQVPGGSLNLRGGKYIQNRPIHVCGVFDENALHFFVDGRLISSIPRLEHYEKSEGNYSIGSERGVSSFLDGTLHELRLSQTVRYREDFIPQERLETDEHTIVLYHFDKGIGEILADASGNGHDGKIHGATWVAESETLIAEHRDFGLHFDGTNDYVELPVIEYPVDQPLTVEAWVRPEQYGIYNEVLSSHHKVQLAIHSGEAVAGMIVKQGDSTSWPGIRHGGLPSGAFHICGTYTQEEMRLYVDGKKVGSTPINSVRTTDQLDFFLGCWDGNISKYSGVIDEARISSVVRYDGDFQPERRFTSDQNTLALYHFEDRIGSILTDSSGNERHGKIHGATWVDLRRYEERRQKLYEERKAFYDAQQELAKKLQDHNVTLGYQASDSEYEGFVELPPGVPIPDGPIVIKMADISKVAFLDEVLPILAQATELEDLRAMATGITPEQMRVLAPLVKIKRLNLSGSQNITNELLGAVADQFAEIDHLWLTDTTLPETGLTALSEMESLYRIYVFKTENTDVAIEAVKNLPNLSTLECHSSAATWPALRLFFEQNRKVGVYFDAAAFVFYYGGTFSTVVDGKEFTVDPDSLHEVTWRQVTGLDLSERAITDQDLTIVPPPDGLRQLNLADTQITDILLQHYRQLTQLQEVNFANTHLTDHGILQLIAFASIKSVDLRGTKATASAIAHLKQRKPDCKFLTDFSEEEIKNAPPLFAYASTIPETSPFDQLKRQNVDPYELMVAGDGDPVNAPEELVGIFGDSRLKHWGLSRIGERCKNNVEFSSDGNRVVAADASGRIIVWDVKTGRQTSKYNTGFSCGSMHVDSESDTVYSFSSTSNEFAILDLNTGDYRKESNRFRGLTSVSADGTVAISRTAGGFTLWQVPQKRTIHTIKTNALIDDLDIDPDGRIAITSVREGIIRFWDVVSGKNIREIDGKKLGFHSGGLIAVSPDRKILASSSRGDYYAALSLVDIESGKELYSYDGQTHAGFNTWLHSLRFSPDGETLAVGLRNRTVILIDVETGEILQQLRGIGHSFISLSFSPDGKLLAGGAPEGGITVWEIETGKNLHANLNHRGKIASTCISETGQHLGIAEWDGSITVLDILRDDVFQTQVLLTNATPTLAINELDNLLATAHNHSLAIFSLTTGEKLNEESPLPTPIRGARFSNDGSKLVVSDSYGHLAILDPFSLTIEAQNLSPDIADNYGMSDSCDRLVGVSRSQSVKHFNMIAPETAEITFTSPEFSNTITDIAVNRDGKYLAVASYQDRNAIQLWDLEMKTKVAEFGDRLGSGDFAQNQGDNNRITFSPDGKKLYAAFDEGEVEVWDLDKINNPEEARSVIKVGGPMDGFYGLHIDPAGKHLITHNGNDTLYVLRLKPEHRGTKVVE